MELVVLILAIVALGVLAMRFGHDSRDGLDWQPPRNDVPVS